jgi:hypothetical protein
MPDCRTELQRYETLIGRGVLLIPAIGYPLNVGAAPLHEMSFEEKLQAMEALCEDSSREPDRIESPSWH